MVTNGARSSLLPSNATPLESSLEQAFAWDFDPDDLRGFKFKTEAILICLMI
jgi:hypothetical protein